MAEAARGHARVVGRERSLRSSHGVLAGMMLAGLVAGCGGSDTPPPEAAPEPVVEQPKAAEPDKSKEAAKLFDALSGELDKLAADKPLDPAWLRDRLMAVVKLDPRHVMARYNLAV